LDFRRARLLRQKAGKEIRFRAVEEERSAQNVGRIMFGG